MSTLSDALMHIRHFLASPEAQPDDNLKAAARAFTDAWNDAARRLERIRAFLADGLAWEAVQLAEAHPPVLEQGPLLLFDQHTEWLQQAPMNDLPAPDVELSMDMLQQVNDAYMAMDRIAPVMRDLHRAVLSRAAPPLRVRVLRALQTANPEQPVWDKEIRALEESRMRILKAALESAIIKKDVGTICYIQRELTADAWTTPPEPSLVRRANDVRKNIAIASAQNRYRELARSMERACGANDEAFLESAAKQWCDLSPILGAPPADAVKIAGPASPWIDAEVARRAADERYANDVRQLEAMFAKNTPIDRIEKIVRDIEASGRTVPDDLLPTLAARRRAHIAAKRRKLIHSLWIAGYVIAVLLLVGLSWRALARSTPSIPPDYPGKYDRWHGAVTKMEFWLNDNSGPLPPMDRAEWRETLTEMDRDRGRVRPKLPHLESSNFDQLWSRAQQIEDTLKNRASPADGKQKPPQQEGTSNVDQPLNRRPEGGRDALPNDASPTDSDSPQHEGSIFDLESRTPGPAAVTIQFVQLPRRCPVSPSSGIRIAETVRLHRESGWRS